MSKGQPLSASKFGIEALESREVLSASMAAAPLAPPTYSFDGSGNNVAHSNWGSAGSELMRTVAAEYADGVSAPAGADRPSAREISNALADSGGADVISDRFLSAFIYAWGQFIDHDLDLTPSGGREYFPVSVPTGDPSFDPAGTGTKSIPLVRSAFDPDTGTDSARQQINSVTAWLDGSMIYGSDAATARALRTLSGGRLKTSAGDLLPFNNATFFPEGTLPMGNDAHRVPDDQLFAAGDIRANENVELTALHTLFVREHNRLADQLGKANPTWNDEWLYQTARSWVIAELQAITYQEWLPALLGQGAVHRYQGYDPTVNPGIANEFSTAAFRLGHSLLGDDVEFLNNRGVAIADEVPLSEAFSNPGLVRAHGIDSILKYLASDPSSELDNQIVDSVRNFLFGPPGSGGLDLASLNIQRGRDHGLADYNAIRRQYGLPGVTSFSQISSNPEVQAKLEALYGNVDNIDAWVGMLAEDHVPGSSVGATPRAVIADQFERLRDGDRFWYEKAFSGRELKALRETTLADLIRRNTELTNLQGNVFFFRATISGTVFADANRDAMMGKGENPLAGRTIELVDPDSSEVIAATQTDRSGRYAFTVADGLRTGIYEVRVPSTESSSSAARTPIVSRMVAITRGEEYVDNVHLGVVPAGPRPAPRPPVAPVNFIPGAVCASPTSSGPRAPDGGNATHPTQTGSPITQPPAPSPGKQTPAATPVMRNALSAQAVDAFFAADPAAGSGHAERGRAMIPPKPKGNTVDANPVVPEPVRRVEVAGRDMGRGGRR